VWGDGHDIRDLLYVDDFIDGMLAAFATDRSHLAVNICAGAGQSIRQILQTILEVDGYANADIRYDPSRPSTISVRLMDNGMARDLLGFTPRVALADGLRRTIGWFRTARGSA
jgi:GDP-L-fucose synthase